MEHTKKDLKARDELLLDADEILLGELAEQVVKGNFTPGIHDSSLIERCKSIESRSREMSFEKWFKSIDNGQGLPRETLARKAWKSTVSSASNKELLNELTKRSGSTLVDNVDIYCGMEECRIIIDDEYSASIYVPTDLLLELDK